MPQHNYTLPMVQPTQYTTPSPVPQYAAPDPQYTAPSAPDPKYTAPLAPDPKYTAPPAPDPKYAAPPAPDPKYTAPPAPDPKYAAPPAPDPKYAVPPAPDPKYAAPPAPDPKYAAPPAPDPKYTAPPAPDPKYAAPDLKYTTPSPVAHYTAQDPTYAVPEPAYPAPLPVTQYTTPKYTTPSPVPQYAAPDPKFTALSPAAQYTIPGPICVAPVPVAQYTAPDPKYTAPDPKYTVPDPKYAMPDPKFMTSDPKYAISDPRYAAPSPVVQYSLPDPKYTAQDPKFSAPEPNYASLDPKYAVANPPYAAPDPKSAPLDPKYIASLVAQYTQFAAVDPKFAAPDPKYPAPDPKYTAPDPKYAAPDSKYTLPDPNYAALDPKYAAPDLKYAAPDPKYAAPDPKYAAPDPKYAALDPKYAVLDPKYAAPDPRYATSDPKYAAPDPKYTTPDPKYTAPDPKYAGLDPTTPVSLVPQTENMAQHIAPEPAGPPHPFPQPAPYAQNTNNMEQDITHTTSNSGPVALHSQSAVTNAAVQKSAGPNPNSDINSSQTTESDKTDTSECAPRGTKNVDTEQAEKTEQQYETPDPKRNVKSCDLDTKYRALKMIEENPKLKRIEVARAFGIPGNTLSTWWKNKDKIMQSYESLEFGPQVKKMRKAAFPDVEKAVDDWLRDAMKTDTEITGPIIIQKAQELARERGHEDFVCTQGWLSRFQTRKNIRLHKPSGDVNSAADNVLVGSDIPEFPQFQTAPDENHVDNDDDDDDVEEDDVEDMDEGEHAESESDIKPSLAELEQESLPKLEQTNVSDIAARLTRRTSANEFMQDTADAIHETMQAGRVRPFLKRKVCDLDTRYHALKMVETHPGLKKAEIAMIFGIQPTTLSTWLKNKEKIMLSYESSTFSPNAKRMRASATPDVEKALDDWLKDAVRSDTPITGALIMEKAESIAKGFGRKDFVCTQGWLARFQARKNIKLRDLQKFSKASSAAEQAEVAANVERWLNASSMEDLVKAAASKTDSLVNESMDAVAATRAVKAARKASLTNAAKDANVNSSTSNGCVSSSAPEVRSSAAASKYGTRSAARFAALEKEKYVKQETQQDDSERQSVVRDIAQKLGVDIGDPEPKERDTTNKTKSPKGQDHQGSESVKLAPAHLPAPVEVTRHNKIDEPPTQPAATVHGALESCAHIRNYLESQPDAQLLFPYLSNIETFIKNTLVTKEEKESEEEEEEK